MEEKSKILDATGTDEIAASVRPKQLCDFIGQDPLKANLSVFIKAARSRSEAMDHALFSGPPGLGKTTLAQIVAAELGVGFRSTAAPMLTKQGDLAAILTGLEPRDVLFIDEIHRLSPAIEEVLYSAMEDFKLDIMIGEGPTAKSIKIDLPPFTLVGATTRTGLLSSPLRDRFGIDLRLNFYDEGALKEIISRSAKILNYEIEPEAAARLALSARGTPRIANRILKRARDFATVMGLAGISRETAEITLARLDIDKRGLDEMDKKYMNAIIRHYAGGPVGIETISALIAEPVDTIEDVIEPYLMQQGFLQRTPRGRVITQAAYKHLGITE
ncbi:MAG: Holliday junction branch migration DNA helicase RuvB [Rickettsiales bacterium]|jgi:Holliday junction DNA helicase RuvB|nr:Holliday junction branch migration DNA helicase RuvB [Rickettsiales bacterium]